MADPRLLGVAGQTGKRSAESERWFEEAGRQIAVLADRGEPFTSEDLLARMDIALNMGTPPEKNAVGGVFTQAARSGLIVKSGKTAPSRRPQSRGRKLDLWVGAKAFVPAEIPIDILTTAASKSATFIALLQRRGNLSLELLQLWKKSAAMECSEIAPYLNALFPENGALYAIVKCQNGRFSSVALSDLTDDGTITNLLRDTAARLPEYESVAECQLATERQIGSLLTDDYHQTERLQTLSGLTVRALRESGVATNVA